MRYEFHPEALEEYQAAARYYEGCQSGLGQRFIDAIEHAIQRIVDKPEQWKPLEKDVRRYLRAYFLIPSFTLSKQITFFSWL